MSTPDFNSSDFRAFQNQRHLDHRLGEALRESGISIDDAKRIEFVLHSMANPSERLYRVVSAIKAIEVWLAESSQPDPVATVQPIEKW